MIKKIFRLTGPELNMFFRSKSRYFKGKIISVKSVRNRRQFSKFAFVVSGPKRSAVKRNLIRRRLSEIVRRVPNKPTEHDVVVFMKLKDGVPGFKELKEDIEYVFSKIILH